MKNKKIVSFGLTLFFAFANCTAPTIQKEHRINIMPKPVKTELKSGKFTINAKTKIVVCYEDVEALKIAPNFAEKINLA